MPQFFLWWTTEGRVCPRLFGKKGSARCCPFFRANRPLPLREKRQRSLALAPPPAAMLEALPKSTIWRAGLMREFPGFSRLGTYCSILPSGPPLALWAGWQHSLRSFLVSRVEWPAGVDVGYMQLSAAGSQRKAVDGWRPLIRAPGGRRRVEKYGEIFQKPTLICRCR